MKLWWLLIFCVLLAPKAYCFQGAAPYPAYSEFDRLTTDSIDKLNAHANNIFLANPAYGRKLASNALIAAKLINYKKGIGQSFLTIGVTYWAQSYYPVSLLYIDTALKYFSKKDNLLLSESYCHMGRIYTDMKDYRSAVYFLEKARASAANNPKKLLDVMVDMSHLYYDTGDFNKAYSTAAKAMQICRTLKDTGTETILYSRFASIYLVRQQYNKTICYYDTAIRMSYQVNNKRLRCASFVEKSNVSLKQNNIDGALDYAKQALAMSDTLGIMNIKARSYRALIAAYEALHNDKQVMYFQKQFSQFQEQRNLLDRQSSSQLMRDYFELSTKLQDISQLKQNAQQNDLRIKTQQQVIIVLIVSMVLLISALCVVWSYYRQKTAIAIQLREQYIATLAQSQIIEKQSHDLEELNNFKSKLLAIIGHDLRAPINNLRNVTDMFEDGSFSADEVHLLMKNINPVVKGAELTLSNLLVWADGQMRGIKSTQPTPVNLLQIIEQTEEICRSSLDKKHITITHNAKANCVALVDENHLKVIFSNLISNAIKFTNGEGSITINVDCEGEKTTVSVADTGIGMSAEEIEKLLSVSTHFTKQGTHGETGTGIGLLLCRELIEINGGKLWLTSTLGKGTIFYFSLPSAK